VVLVCAGLGLLAKNGMVDADGLNGLAAALPFAGMILGRVVRSPFDPSGSPAEPAPRKVRRAHM
jgi:hypothetical protein